MIEMTLVEKFSEDEQFDGMIFADGFDDAFIGIVYDIAPKAVYNRQKVIEIIIQDDFDTDALGKMLKSISNLILFVDAKERSKPQYS
jgi:hypothetical protein